MNKKFHFLYKTTCTVTHKFYIGIHSTNRIEDGYLGSGTHLTYSIKKYGKNNHVREILEYFDNRNDLVNREIEVVNESLLKDDMCMNISLGGINANMIHNAEFMMKISKRLSECNMGKRNPMYGKTWITNGIESKIISSGDIIPYGWYVGRKLKNFTKSILPNKNIGKIAISNIEKTKIRFIHKNEIVPEGWYIGNYHIDNRKSLNKNKICIERPIKEIKIDIDELKTINDLYQELKSLRFTGEKLGISHMTVKKKLAQYKLICCKNLEDESQKL